MLIKNAGSEQIGNIKNISLSDYEDDDEEDLSDTDPEDEWESQAI